MKNNKSGVLIRNNVIYVQGHIDGVFYRKSTKKEATKVNLIWAHKNARQILLDLLAKTKRPTAPTLKEYGLRSLLINAHDRKANTNKDYEGMFKQHIVSHFGRYELAQIRPSDLKEWQNALLDKGLSGKRINGIRTVFRGILQDAFYDELIERNPFDVVRRPKIKAPEIYPFNIEEIQLLVKNAHGWFKNFLLIAFFTGMRTGELLGLKWVDINFPMRTLDVKRTSTRGQLDTPKTLRSIRTIDILPVVYEALMAQRELTYALKGFVFLNQYEKRITDASSIRKHHWVPLLKKAEIEHRILYQTRHTFASIMLQQGEEIGWVSNMMGHTDIHTTLTRYARYLPRTEIERAKFLEEVSFEKSAQKLHTVKARVEQTPKVGNLVVVGPQRLELWTARL